jgi:uncharacterized membrane protein
MVPPAAAQEIGQRVIETVVAQRFQGPLPPPSMLAEYEQTLPGCAERIVAMVEAEGNHRRDCELQVIQAGIRLSHIGQVMALLIAMSTLALAGLLLYENKKIGGLAALVIGIGTLAGVFYYAQRRSLSTAQRDPGTAHSDHGDDGPAGAV